MKRGVPRALLITADKKRHIYAAHKIKEALELVGVICERKDEVGINPAASAPAADREVLKRHFDDLRGKEEEYFGASAPIPEKETLYIKRDALNGLATLGWIKGRAPEIILLYGCGIVGEPILRAYKDRVINMHLGLSPYYRGSATNFWPFVNNEPECCGVTVHLAAPKIDGGPILRQGRPEPSLADTAQDLGCKSVIMGVDILIKSATDYYKRKIMPLPQKGGGRFYAAGDFCADAVRKMRKNFEDGMMGRFISDYSSRIQRFPIITGDGADAPRS